MAETLEPVADEVDPQQLAEQLLAQAKAQGVDLVGPGGLLNRLTRNVLETALEAEMSEHLGYDKHDVAGRTGGNSRNGTRAKTVLTRSGRCRSTCRVTPTPRSTRRSCANVNAVSTGQ
jgi:hypothetical protein